MASAAAQQTGLPVWVDVMLPAVQIHDVGPPGHRGQRQ